MVTIGNFNEDQYAATEDTRCIQVVIPDDDSYVPLLAGLLALAGRPENYLIPDSDQAEGVAAIWSDAYRLSDWEGCNVQRYASTYIDLWSFMATVNAGAYTLTSQTTQVFAFYSVTDTTANRHIISVVRLVPGSYSIKTYYFKSSIMGIADLALCNASGSVLNQLQTSIDMYGANVANNVLSNTFTISSEGEYQIRVRNQGFKNTSSFGYAMNVTVHHIERTGD